jgi:hypothetical protein
MRKMPGYHQLLCCVIVLVLGLTMAQRGPDYVPEDDSWITVANLGDTVILNCTGQAYPNDTVSRPESWMFPTPDLIVINVTFNDFRIWVDANGWELVITDLRQNDLGQYHCMLLSPQGEYYLARLGINVKGPYFEDLWLKYRSNVILGISVTAIFLISYAIGHYIYYRWFDEDNIVAPQDDEGIADRPASSSSTNKQGNVTPPLSMDNRQRVVDNGHTPIVLVSETST